MSDKIISVSAGCSYSLALDEYGNVWAWGWNYYGELGDNSNTSRYTPVLTDKSLMSHKIVAISAGENHSLAVDETGDVWAWGGNGYGKLGDGYIINKNTPVRTDKSHMTDKIIAVSAGSNHSLALDEYGNVWAWGRNNWGQLGDNSNVTRYTPVRTDNSLMSYKIVAISAGQYHSMALDETGDVWTWGSNNSGQLGDNTNTERYVPVKSDKSLMSDKIVTISAGDIHSLALDKNGDVWAWGRNYSGQLGDGSNTNRNTPVKTDKSDMSNKIASISAGGYHSLAIQQSDNCWWIWIIILALILLLLYIIWRILHCNCC